MSCLLGIHDLLSLGIVFFSLFHLLELVRLSRCLHKLDSFAETTKFATDFVIDLSVWSGSHLGIDFIDCIESTIQVCVLLVQEVGHLAVGSLSAELPVVGLLSVFLVDCLLPVNYRIDLF